MIYVIADLSNYENVYVFFPIMMLFAVFGGMLNMTQHLINEGRGKSTTNTTAYNYTNTTAYNDTNTTAYNDTNQ